MGYTMSVHLNDNIETEQIVKFLKDAEYLKESHIKWISDNPDGHSYSVPHKKGKGIYVSFSTLGDVGSFFLHNFFAMLGKEFGQKINYEDKEYSYFLYDDEISLIIDDNEEYKKRREDEFKVKFNRKKLIGGFYHYYESINEYDYPFSMFDKINRTKEKYKNVIKICNDFKDNHKI